MANRLLWNSPAIPESAFESDDALDAVTERVLELHLSDMPSSNDRRAIFHRYNEATPEEREAIDAAFVWLTGYTLATIAAMAVSGSGDYEKVLAEWRRGT